MSRRRNTKSYVLILVALATVLKVSLASHFRGGTISWQPTGTPLEVEFKFKLGWTYGSGAGCTPSLVGQYVNKTTFSWSCSSGCTSKVVIGRYGYTCLAASQPENWELGEYNFRYTFNNTGPFTVEYTGGAWISLDYGSGGGNWRVGTVVDLRDRSDTGRPNYSPVSVGKPLYTLKYGCTIVLRIPVIDQEGDNVRCRWSVGDECASVCNSIPSTVLNEENCTLTISTTHTQGGMYAVAVTIEDRPKTDITLGGQRYTPNDVISSVPMQFLVYTPVMTQSCSDKPMFVDPTPLENSVIVLAPGETLYVSLYATSKGTSITSFRTFGLTGSRQSNIWVVAPIRPTVYGIDVTWTPALAQKGPVTLCAEATDNYGLSSDLHCFTIVAWDINPCDSSPCMHNATCTRLGYTEDFTCNCIPGYTDVLCETVKERSRSSKSSPVSRQKPKHKLYGVDTPCN